MKYRPEIDGLRAIAIISVLLFHAKFAIFSGGYLGVDIFFVISGYLITTILLNDLSADKFSILNFYERRARRILPAFFIVVFFSMIAAWFLMTPLTAKFFYQSAIYSTLSISNITFALANENDYFDFAAELKPLLHTWTLGLEEQFYIFFPITLFVIWKFCRKYLLHFIIAGIIFSLLAASFLLFKRQPILNFYLLPSRGWELLAGSLIAYLEMKSAIKIKAAYASFLAGFGLLMIILSILLFKAETPHPSYLTLLPITGTMLVIAFSRSDCIAKKILSARVLVFVGLMSYSLYLWHNPIFSFARLYMIDPPTKLHYAGLIAVSSGIAYLSYRYVETPFRDRNRFGNKAIWSLSAVCAAIVIGVSSFIISHKVFPERFAEDFRPVLIAEESKSADKMKVDGRLCNDRLAQDACVIGDTSVKPSWAIVGDSHAAAMGLSAAMALKEKGQSALFYGQNGCAYLVGSEFDIDRRKRCGPYTQYVHQRINQPDIKNVILMNRYKDGENFDEKKAA